MQTNIATKDASQIPAGTDFAVKITQAIDASQKTGRPFFVLVFQIANLDSFLKRRSETVVYNLMREVGISMRKVIHTSQFVGRFQNGFGLVFDAVELGEMDSIARKLSVLIQNVIKAGKYNDLSGRWTEIVYQFLNPRAPMMIFPRVGWAVYPRDGETAQSIVKRALLHIQELAR